MKSLKTAIKSALKQPRKPLILAPAGSFESLRAAINAGCDAVFFGISDFNMRATASKNFTLEDLPKVVELCRENNVETDLTVNTVMYDEDLPRMREVVDAANSAGVNCVIVSDFATIQYASKYDMDICISTQLSVSNIEAVRYYSKFAGRIVLARELTLEQVTNICTQVREQEIKGPKGKLIEIEVFAHGAMCVALSGRCSMSLYTYGTSANRGACTQPCRRPYKVTDIQTGRELVVDNNYVMSASDLCTIGMIPELIKSGVSVLKLEGRGRSPEYVDVVVNSYREAVESCYDGTYSDEKVAKWNEALGTVFNRGNSTGSYMGRHFDEWSMTPNSRATEEKIKIGRISNYFAKAGVVELTITEDQEMKVGDKITINGEITGLVRSVVKEIFVHINDKPSKVETAKQGDLITFSLEKKVRKGDEVFVLQKVVR